MAEPVCESARRRVQRPAPSYNLPAMPFDTLTIVGVGLIGGSVGLAARERGLARRVVGVGRSAESLWTAKTHGAIDEAMTDVAAGPVSVSCAV